MKRKGTAAKRSKKSPARSGNLPVKQVTAADARAVKGGTLNKDKVASKAPDAVHDYLRR